MKLYNTRTRKVEELKPLTDNTVRIYSCGPTVYDHAHIGNLSAYIFADTLRRAVKIAGYDVLHAMNYTDVDDKTIQRSRQKYPNLEPKAALKKLTDEYIGLFLSDMQRIGNDTRALTFLRATDDSVIDGMRSLIVKLHAGEFAYVADDGVYFSIDAYRKTGKTYGQLLELTLEDTSVERIRNDEYDKESAHDFALWKKQKLGEPAWEFMLNGHDLTGRPGWHIECSVMSRQALGQPFDIHTGGIDLIFPHHENEIAQSTACEANPIMAAIFAHNEHILVDGKKMAKSAKNFYTLQEIVDKGHDPLAFRLLVLQAHYRSQAHFSWENLNAAQNRLKAFQAFADLRFQIDGSDTGAQVQLDFSVCGKQLRQAFYGDLDTPEGLAVVSSVIDSSTQPIHQTHSASYLGFLKGLDDMLGLKLLDSKDISDGQKQLIAGREKARKDKDWTRADELRDRLEGQGIGLRDTPNGAVWFRL